VFSREACSAARCAAFELPDIGVTVNVDVEPSLNCVVVVCEPSGFVTLLLETGVGTLTLSDLLALPEFCGIEAAN